MTAPWNGWYHCIGSTYGSWLPGDPRGFRLWRHRQHIEGDYRNPPPPGRYAGAHRRSMGRMGQDAVKLRPQYRRTVCLTMGRFLVGHRVELIDLSVGACHFHAICRFPRTLPSLPANLLADGRDPIPRHLLGRAKRAASIQLGRLGRKPRGPRLWARRGKVLPVRDRGHQVAVVRYIRKHLNHGAALWSVLRADPSSR